MIWRLSGLALLGAVLFTIERTRRFIVATAAENQAAIDALAVQAEKAKTEIISAVGKLEQAAAAGQELDFTALRSAVGGLDDLNPDAVTEGGTETTEGESTL